MEGEHWKKIYPLNMDFPAELVHLMIYLPELTCPCLVLMYLYRPIFPQSFSFRSNLLDIVKTFKPHSSPNLYRVDFFSCFSVILASFLLIWWFPYTRSFLSGVPVSVRTSWVQTTNWKTIFHLYRLHAFGINPSLAFCQSASEVVCCKWNEEISSHCQHIDYI